ncbi:MAG: hypothetical protein EOO11_06715 [Chitinophagaceae bacterium]|nr:MAG: hypothetical protein EOO11_06715 [Chitinophagaceae bacterium]
MKNKLYFLLSALLVIGMWSCKKQEHQVSLEGGTKPVLAASLPNDSRLALDYYIRDQHAVTFNWTNPDYRFTTGLSSQPVTYKLEIDTVGSNFSNPRRRSFNFTGDLSKSFTHAELNDLLTTGLRLKDSMEHNIEVRVNSYLGLEGAQLSSESFRFKVTPYDNPPKVTPPTSGELFITGSATPGGWMGDNAPPLNSQKFTRINNTTYELSSIALNGDQSFLFVPVYGNWSTKYGFTGAGNSNIRSGDEFKQGGNDLRSPLASGNYKIVVDFKLGTYTVTPI